MSTELKIATLRGPSAVEMIKMIDDAKRYGGTQIPVFDEPGQILTEMTEGSVDFAVLPAAMDHLLRARGIAYYAAAVMIRGGLFLCGIPGATGTPDATGLHGKADENTVKALKGTVINVLGTHTPPEQMLRHLIRKAGLDPDNDLSFSYDYPTHRELADAAVQGKPGLFLLPEPFLSVALEADNRLKVLLDISEEWRKAEGTLPAITALFRKNGTDSATTARIISELERSCQWVKENPAEAAELVSKHGIFRNERAVEASIPRSGFDVVGSMV